MYQRRLLRGALALLVATLLVACDAVSNVGFPPAEQPTSGPGWTLVSVAPGGLLEAGIRGERVDDRLRLSVVVMGGGGGNCLTPVLRGLAYEGERGEVVIERVHEPPFGMTCLLTGQVAFTIDVEPGTIPSGIKTFELGRECRACARASLALEDLDAPR